MMMGFVLHTQIGVLQLKKPITQAGEQQNLVCAKKYIKKGCCLGPFWVQISLTYHNTFVMN